MFLQILAVIAEFEANLIRQRTREGMDIAQCQYDQFLTPAPGPGSGNPNQPGPWLLSLAFRYPTS